MIILVDADTLVYTAGFASERAIDWDGSGVFQAYGHFDDAVQRIEHKMREYQDVIGDAAIILCLSDTEDCFRKDIYPEYKANRRVGQRRPLLFNPLREWMAKEYEVVLYAGLEGDDVLGVLGTQLPEAVMLSIDKDLMTVPGRHFNPDKDTEVRHVSRKEAADFHLFQTLVGDSVDNYPGCPGIGAKKAPALVERGWEGVLEAFEKKGLTEQDALTQARLAFILRDGHYDNQTNTVRLWSPDKETA